DTIVQARPDYAKLDAAGSATRVRLSCTVVRVQPDGDGDRAGSVRIGHLRDGKMHAVRASNVVLACNNALIGALMPELPAKQKEALAYPAKVPMMYNNVLVRRWTAFAHLGVSNVSSPCMLHPGTSLDPGSTVGSYRGVTTP